jgi:uncharacterized Zn finger protein (UPF0148 family)
MQGIKMANMTCPQCGSEMKTNKHGANVCPNCKGVFLPESMFGVT